MPFVSCATYRLLDWTHFNQTSSVDLVYSSHDLIRFWCHYCAFCMKYTMKISFSFLLKKEKMCRGCIYVCYMVLLLNFCYSNKILPEKVIALSSNSYYLPSKTNRQQKHMSSRLVIGSSLSQCANQNQDRHAGQYDLIGELWK